MKTTSKTTTPAAKKAAASTPQDSSRWIEFNPTWEDAKALEKAAVTARMTVTDFCRTIIEKEAVAKVSKSKILPVSGVPSGNRWPFKVTLQTWFKVRDHAARHGITIEQWAHAVIAKAIHSGGATAATKTAKASLQISEFIVTERWVKITAKIREEHFPKFRPEADPERAVDFLVSGYATSLNIYTRAAKQDGCKSVGFFDISIDANKWGYNRMGTLNLTRSKEITFRMEERKWGVFMENCDFLGHPPEAVIRGAFGSRATGEGMPGHRSRN